MSDDNHSDPLPGDEYVRELLSRLKRGELLDDILRSRQRANHGEFLERCAVPRWFDLVLVREVILEGMENPPDPKQAIEELEEKGSVEQVPEARAGERYRVVDGLRSDYLRSWAATPGTDRGGPPQVPDWLRKLSGRLVAHFDGRRDEPGADLEALYHAVLSDRQDTRRRFEELFREAEERFDLGRCMDLTRVLQERPPFLDPDLEDSLYRHETYLRARTQWSREFYATVHYEDRGEARAELEALLGDDSPERWLLTLEAPGGMGKSTFLRWAIARYCVPRRIPCASVDFSFIDPLTATRAVWLLLLEVSEQLRRQIPEDVFLWMNYFYELDEHMSEYRKRLSRFAGPGTSLSLPEGVKADWVNKMVSEFTTALGDSRLTTKVLLIFDTMEAATANQTAELKDVLATVGRIHAGFKRLRVVLSGRRYGGGQGLADLVAGFPKQVRTVTLGRFTHAEAEDYLIRKRSLPPGELANEVIKKTDRHPFTLALYADLLRARPGITLDEIRAYDDPGLALVIERIIEQIQDRRVRWVVRYGVIPRVLTRYFLHDVMAEPLLRAMSKGPFPDNPKKDPVPEAKRKTLYPRKLVDRAEPLDTDALWRSLTRYASDMSWVTQEGGEEGTLVFQDYVLDPMRALLRKEHRETFDLLHELALQFYQKQAGAGPSDRNWGRFIREAVYHKFQREGPAAGDYWRAQIDALPLWGNPQWRRELAADLLSDDYNGLVDDATLARAQFEAIWAVLAEARLDPSADAKRWEQIEQRLDAAEARERKSGREVIPKARRALARAEVMLARGRPQDALHLLQEVRTAAESLELRFEVAQRLAAVQAVSGSAESSVEAFEDAKKLALQLGASASVRMELIRNQVQQLVRARQYDRAAQTAHQALAIAPPGGSEQIEFMRTLALILLRMGQLDTAVKVLRDTGAATASRPELALEGVRGLYAQARVRLAAREPQQALELVAAVRSDSKILAETSGASDWAREMRMLLAEGLELDADALGALMEFPAAAARLDEAQDAFRRVPFLVGGLRARRSAAALQLDGVGNLKKARSLLEYLRPAMESLGHEAVAGIDLMSCRARARALQRFQGSTRELQKEVAALLARVEDGWSPDLIVEIALEALTHGEGEQPLAVEALRRLTAELQRVSPPPARLMMLDSLRRCHCLSGLPENLLNSFADLFPEGDDGPDWAILGLARVEVERVCGHTEAALRRLNEIAPALLKAGNFVSYHDALAAHDHLGWKHGEVEAIPREAFDPPKNLSRFRVLRGTWLCRHARRFINQREYAKSDPYLNDALNDLGSSDAVTSCLEEGLLLSAQIAQESGDAERERAAILAAAEVAVELYGEEALRANRDKGPAGRTDFCLVRFERADDLSRDNILATFSLADHAPLHRRLRAADDLLLAEVLGAGAFGFLSEAWVVHFVKDWDRCFAAMRNWLMSREQASELARAGEAAGRKLDLRLEVRRSPLIPLPWETCNPVGPSSDVPYGRLYRGVGAPSAVDRGSGSDRARVLLIQYSRERGSQTSRRAGQSAESSASYYSSRGVEVSWLDKANPALVSSAFANQSPDIIHIRAVMKRSPSLGIFFDFLDVDPALARSGVGTRPGEGVLTAASLASALDIRPARNARPVVVLEVVDAPGITERVRQVLLRNDFATALAELGVVRGVVATGPWSQYRERVVDTAVADALERGEPLWGLVDRLRNQAGMHPFELETGLAPLATPGMPPGMPRWSSWATWAFDPMTGLAPLATALFANDPDVPLRIKLDGTGGVGPGADELRGSAPREVP